MDEKLGSVEISFTVKAKFDGDWWEKNNNVFDPDTSVAPDGDEVVDAVVRDFVSHAAHLLREAEIMAEAKTDIAVSEPRVKKKGKRPAKVVSLPEAMKSFEERETPAADVQDLVQEMQNEGRPEQYIRLLAIHAGRVVNAERTSTESVKKGRRQSSGTGGRERSNGFIEAVVELLRGYGFTHADEIVSGDLKRMREVVKAAKIKRDAEMEIWSR